jgi:hypothetical protein
MLHFTNGSSVSLADTGLGGEVVCWADVLHEGPVPAGLSLEQLSRLRHTFFASQWPDFDYTLEQRNAALQRFADHEEVVLWFEHDLYDQLQLIQILDWFHERDLGSTRLSMICIGAFPGVEPFHGLGQLTGVQLASLWPLRRAVTLAETALAAAAWRAFRSPDPVQIERLLLGDTTALPFLRAALIRHLQEFPSVENGLGRIQRQILELVEGGASTMQTLFPAQAAREESVFLGDTIFELHLRWLTECRNPLLEASGGNYRVTQAGREVLNGRADQVRLNGSNRWLGGVHLNGSEALWRWDEGRRRLVAH